MNANDGSEIWRFPTGDWVMASPAVAGGMIYICSKDNNLYCLDVNDGSEIWRYQLQLYASSPAVLSEKLYIGSPNGSIYCLEGKNNPPREPCDPSPSNGATNVDVDVVLSWN